jgi:hypothetical protein
MDVLMVLVFLPLRNVVKKPMATLQKPLVVPKRVVPIRTIVIPQGNVAPKPPMFSRVMAPMKNLNPFRKAQAPIMKAPVAQPKTDGRLSEIDKEIAKIQAKSNSLKKDLMGK